MIRFGQWEAVARWGRPPARVLWPAYAELALAMATVGASAVLGKRMVEELPVAVASVLRFGLASLILGPLLLRQAGGWPRLARGDVATLFLQAAFGVFGFTLCWLYGLRLTSAAEGGIVASAAPAVIVLASFLLLGERPGGRGLAGVALAVGGVGAMTLAGEIAGGGLGRGPNPLLGNGLILLATVGEALFFVLGKRVGARVSPLAIATWVTLFGFVLFLPLALVEAPGVDLAAVSGGAWLAVLLYALGPTVVGYLLAYRGLARVPASAVALFTGIVPVTAVILAALFLGEPIGWIHGLGLGAVLAGIVVGLGGSARPSAVSANSDGVPPSRQSPRHSRNDEFADAPKPSGFRRWCRSLL